MADDIGGDGASSHTSSRMSSPIEVVSRVSGRRRWTVEQKLSILRDAFGAGGSVRAAVERHDVGSGALYTWRRQAMSGELSGTLRPALPAFAEVQIAVPVAPPPILPVAAETGRIGIELPTGVRITVDASVDADALARVLGALAR